MDVRRILITGLAFALAVMSGFYSPTAAYATDDEQYGLGLARVSYLTGDVLFSEADSEEWSAVSPNFPLREGDRVWSGEDSKAEVRFETGETAWLNYQSELEMLNLTRGDDGNIYHVGVPYGEGTFDVKNFEVLGSVFQVATPNTSVRAFGRARFRISSLENGTTQIGVSRGSVEVESENGIANVDEGELLEVYSDGRSRIMDLPREDDWDRWVESRADTRTGRTASTRYLPREMHSYADEFDEGGRWVSYPEYGHVWVPTVAAGWTPYSYGRWVWRGYDYVWLPYDPWYAPFHYGRWHWTVSFGWCWVPPLPGWGYWSPGYVGWVWDSDYVYWVPLAPGEVYFGYGYFGPGAVNVYHTTVIVNRNVYVNCRVRGGVVGVHRDRFLHGHTDRIRIDTDRGKRLFRHRDRDHDRDRHFGRPPSREIKAVRETRLPRPDARVDRGKLPSERVRERARELRNRRVVKGDDKSAFERGRRPRPMKDLERMRRPEFKRNGGTERGIQREQRREDRQRDRTIRREDRRDDRQQDRTIRREDRREDRQRDRTIRREDRRQDRQQDLIIHPEDPRDDRQQDRTIRREDRREDRQQDLIIHPEDPRDDRPQDRGIQRERETPGTQTRPDVRREDRREDRRQDRTIQREERREDRQQDREIQREQRREDRGIQREQRREELGIRQEGSRGRSSPDTRSGDRGIRRDERRAAPAPRVERRPAVQFRERPRDMSPVRPPVAAQPPSAPTAPSAPSVREDRGRSGSGRGSVGRENRGTGLDDRRGRGRDR